MSSLPEPQAELSELQRAILDFEGKTFQYAAQKDRKIQDQLGITPIRYFQMLNRLRSYPPAFAYAPMTMNRLQHMQDS